MPNENQVQRFMDLFRGSERSHAIFVFTGDVDERGKHKGKYTTHYTAATAAEYNLHLSGDLQLVVSPVLGDRCVFGAIDIDVYQGFDLAKLEETIKSHGMPLIPVRSKSGGCHAYLFLKEPESCMLIQIKLKEWSKLLGHKDAEIFPKQTRLGDDDLGSCINLPYQNAAKPLRYAIRNGSPLSFDEFLDYAESRRVALQECVKIGEKEPYKDAPPCIQALAKAGVLEGQRHEVRLALATYAKLKKPKAWHSELVQLDTEIIGSHDYHGAEDDRKGVIKSYEKKEYAYRCDQEPLASHCDKVECAKRKYGYLTAVGKASIIMPSTLTLIKDTPEMWIAEVDNKLVYLTTDELDNQQMFRKKCISAFKMRPSVVKDAEWSLMINELLQGSETVEPLDLRMAAYQGAVYLDLAQEDTIKAVEITKDDWRVIDRPPKYFRRTSAMKALPEPVRGGDLDADLESLLGLSGATLTAVKGFLVHQFQPLGARLHLAFKAEGGSGKTIRAFIIRSILDPNIAPFRPLVDNEQQMIITARNSQAVIFDNISHITADQSDMLCRLSTGAGFGARQLYTNLEEITVALKRSAILTGISNIVKREDLAQRTVFIELPPIAMYRTETDIKAELHEKHARILGAILDHVVQALRNLDATPVQPRFRMADAVQWIEASGIAPGFTEFYAENQLVGASIAVEEDTLGSRLEEYLLAHQPLENITFKALRDKLDSVVFAGGKLPKGWPETSSAFSANMQRLLPALRKKGWIIDIHETGKGHANKYTFRFDTKAEVERLIEEIPF
jgi:hypothetical protein